MKQNSSIKHKWQYIVIGICGIISIAILSIGISISSTLFLTDLFEKEETEGETKTQTNIYHSVEEVQDSAEEFNGQDVYIYGYLCNEIGIIQDTNSTIAWITDIKLASKDEVNNIIRIESTEELGYTPKAIIAFGTFNIDTTTNSLVLSNAKLYNYTGNNLDMIEHNTLIDNNLIETILDALMYAYTEDVTAELNVLIDIACNYSDEQLEETLMKIRELATKKQSLSETEFNERAEEYRAEFIKNFINYEEIGE